MARSWAIATHTTVLSGGFLPLKAKARALVKVVVAEYEECELPAQASEMSSRSRIKTLQLRNSTGCAGTPSSFRRARGATPDA